MSAPAIDYDSLAKQYGATSSQAAAIDYDALAKQHGAISSDASQQAPAAPPQPQSQPGLLDRIKSEASAVYQHPGQAALGAAKAIPGLFQSLLPSAGTMQDPLLPQETKGPSKVADVYNKISGAVTQATTPQNEAQQGGAHAITAASLAAPGVSLVKAGVEAIPTAEKASKLFQSVAADANKVPVQLENSHDAAIRLMDWQKKTQLGPTLNKFLNRITNPKLGQITYEEARDYQQLISRLSSDEASKMAPAVQFQVKRLAAGLKQDIGTAAGQVGRAADYYKAMGDYHHAKQLQEWYEGAKDLGKDAMVKAGLGAAGLGGAYGLYKLSQ